MFIDLNKVDSDPFRDKRYDVCICGAGVAGITLALKLSRSLNIVLLEAGGYEFSDHWTGWCRPLDSYDFKRKPYVEYSGWPIERSDLDPYLEEAKVILDIPPEGKGGENSSSENELIAIRKSKGFRQIDFWFSSPTRFALKYKQAIESMPNLTCCLNANLVDISLGDNLSNVEQVKVRDYLGRAFNIGVRTLVLAAGGIENPRLLLNCNSQMSDGLGNGNGFVGRFFTEHPHQKVAKFLLVDGVKARLAHNWVNRLSARRFFAPTERFMQQEGILNFGIRFLPKQPARPDARSSFKAKLRKVLCGSEALQGVAEQIRGEEIACPIDYDGELHIASEQALNPSSRIVLGSESDRFGMRRVVLDWRLSNIDKDTIQRALIRFAETFAALDLGRVQLDDWLVREDAELPPTARNVRGWSWGIGGHHHMCTTRMGSSPREGVVDSTQKIFGVDNLYLAGSSVFATGGHANPTFTIVQMTLRLADHLNGVHRARI